MVGHRMTALATGGAPAIRGRAVGAKVVAALAVVGLVFVLPAVPASSQAPGDIPAAVDPGIPSFSGDEDPVPDEPAAFDPASSMLEAMYEADLAAGGESFWFDRVLERPGSDPAGTWLLTRGRALYMYTHTPGTLGFAGGYAYRERTSNSNQHLYTVTMPGASLSESVGERRQYPSHWSSVHTATGLTVRQRKFITENNVAVTNLTLTNTSLLPIVRTLQASSPIAATPSADGSELTGTVTTRYQVTRIFPRLSGEGFEASGAVLTRTVTLAPGESVTVKVQLGAIAEELPESMAEYERYRGYGPDEAFKTHLAEYNRWWVDNTPYIDVPDPNIKKMSYYRTFLNRFNLVDANVPGNDYQFPVSIEGVLGYNNAIQLTQPMHMQDLKYFRDPIYAYGNLLSSGETSKCDAFIDNPGSHSWGNTYEQYIAREAWNAFKVHGGDPELVRNFAHYAECDVKGQLDKYDSQGNYLIEYPHGFLTGNDHDATSFVWAHPSQGNAANRQDRAESAFWYAGAKGAAEAYALIGEEAKAAEMGDLADNMREAIMGLWDDNPAEPGEPTAVPATRVEGQAGFGNAVRLNGPEPNQYVSMPTGIVSGLSDFTIATWVNRATTSGQSWSRVFDFGSGTSSNMFLTVNAGGAGVRFAITTSGSGGEQQITAAPQLPTGWQHVAVTKSGNIATLYVNGSAVGTNPSMTLSPSSLGNTTNNWIGRSQYADPLLNATIDEFQIYDRALAQTEIQSLMATPGGESGGGNVAWYRFDEEGNGTALDSSGNQRHGTVVTPVTGETPGQVFKHRLVNQPFAGQLVPWKDQQNFAPFIERVPPTDDPKFREALRYYADAESFPIMPFFTSDQRDKAEAAAMGRGGSNNFSNINSTLQAQVFSAAIRDYPSDYITPTSYLRLLEWLTWTQYVDGDNRFPDNNEFFNSYDPENQTMWRSWIHHNILGAYNFMLIDDIAGVRPRLDDAVELWPIDVGWDHFTVDNLRYHGRDLTVVWNEPGVAPYEGVPVGYSAYVDGQRVFTVDALAHVEWDSTTGVVSVLDGSDTAVLFSTASPVSESIGVSLRDNARMVDMLQKAGVDISAATGWQENLAVGKPVSASFTTTSPSLRATAPEHAVSGFTVSGLPSGSGGNNFGRSGYQSTNTIWGTQGSPNAQDWFEVDLEESTRFDTVKLYFFSDKTYSTQQNNSGNTYRAPSAYTVQYHDGEDWVDVPDQVKTPATPLPNYNKVEFEPVIAQRVRVLLTPTGSYGIGLKEIQVLHSAFDFDGFFSPVSNPPAVNDVSAGRSIPVKFSLGGDYGDDIFEEGSPSTTEIDCQTLTTVRAVAEEQAGKSSLQYDAASDTYSFVWKTKSEWSGTCRQLSVALIDGTVHTAWFSFR